MVTIRLSFPLLLLLLLPGCPTVNSKNIPDPLLATAGVHVASVSGTSFTLEDGRTFQLAGVTLDSMDPEDRAVSQSEFAKATQGQLLLQTLPTGEARLMAIAYVNFHNPICFGDGIHLFPIEHEIYPSHADVALHLIGEGLVTPVAAWKFPGGTPRELNEISFSWFEGNDVASQYMAADKHASAHHLGRYTTDAERLAMAIRTHNRNEIAAMMERGVDPNLPDCTYDRPFLPWAVAIECNDMETFRLLVKHGAKFISDKGEAPWGMSPTPELVDALLDLKAPLPMDENAGQVLMNLARARQINALTRLLDAGVNPNSRLNMGVTPLMYAARDSTLAIVKTLVEHGADPTLQSHSGETALDSSKKNPEIQVYLRSLQKQPRG